MCGKSPEKSLQPRKLTTAGSGERTRNLKKSIERKPNYSYNSSRNMMDRGFDEYFKENTETDIRQQDRENKRRRWFKYRWMDEVEDDLRG